MKNPVISNSWTLSEHSIKQSMVGDCGFLCAIIVAVNYEKRFNVSLIKENIYPQDSKGPMYNPSGKYLLRMFWNGTFI